ncbi:MAG: 4Fe-4S ferredoxin, partial [Ruminococcus sp.]|nr:4Fe-4S ferredoxin [Ruminococcus sp.]
MLKISLENLSQLFDAVAEKQTLYIPADRADGAAEYKKYESGMKLSNNLNTLRSAKDFFFPQTENLADFKMEGKKIEVIDIREESEDFVVFGVRACDARSFTILDKVFLSEPVDSYYKNRRDHGTIVTMS